VNPRPFDGGQRSSGVRSSHTGYSKWEQVSGYFDGDGGLKINIGQFTIQVLVMWSDTDYEQLEHIAEFLLKRRILPEGPYLRRGQGKSNDAYNLFLSAEGGGLVALKCTRHFVDKKRGQVEAAIDYLEDRITGDEFIRRINVEVKRKKRRAPRRPFLSGRPCLPSTKSEGLEKRSALAAAKVRLKLGLNFDEKKTREIRNAVIRDKKPISQVAKQYGVSWNSIWRYATGRRGRIR
jgi:hypothetical protein